MITFLICWFAASVVAGLVAGQALKPKPRPATGPPCLTVVEPGDPR